MACETIVPRVGLASQEDVRAGLAALREGSWNDLRLRERLERLVEQLDDEYFRLYEVDDTMTPEALRYFAKARAVAAIGLALTHQDSELHEAIYEAIAADEDSERVLDAVAEALSMKRLRP